MIALQVCGWIRLRKCFKCERRCEVAKADKKERRNKVIEVLNKARAMELHVQFRRHGLW
jgi:hypothetical protein